RQADRRHFARPGRRPPPLRAHHSAPSTPGEGAGLRCAFAGGSSGRQRKGSRADGGSMAGARVARGQAQQVEKGN
ncbi:MAG TPA: hypothetical protein VER33_19730, partial [Polyangiaceae bacterium]|nr:hypothetical protein [Polyangiaceae bacterium]